MFPSTALTLALALALGACAGPAQQTVTVPATKAATAPARTVISPPNLPSGVDIDTVPVGSWAEYETTVGKGTSITVMIRIAVVARGPEGTTIERALFGRGLERVVHAITLAAELEGKRPIVKSVFQIGADTPTESAVAKGAKSPHPKADPNKLIGTETLTVRAGTFDARRYRDKTEYGERIDFWISDTAGPLGLVKLEAEQKQDPRVGGRFQSELVAKGTDAKPEITRPAVPFVPKRSQ